MLLVEGGSHAEGAKTAPLVAVAGSGSCSSGRQSRRCYPFSAPFTFGTVSFGLTL